MSAPTDVLCVAACHPGHTTVARVAALRANGFNVRIFDTSATLLSGAWVFRALEDRLLMGPRLAALNRRLIQQISSKPPVQVVWIDKGRWLYPQTLLRMKTLLPNATFIHYTPDPAFYGHRSRHFEASVGLYDICVTTKEYELDWYRSVGAHKVIFTLQGVDDRFSVNPSKPELDRPTAAIFIGHYEPHYEHMLSELCENVGDVEIYGNGWQENTTSPAVLKCVKGSGAWGSAYFEKLSHSKIGIGLLSKKYPDQFTTRTFEIPASGAFLLAERTEKHSELFEGDVEASFFSTPSELAEKAAYYIANDELRRQHAEFGQARALTNYTWHEVLQPVFRYIRD